MFASNSVKLAKQPENLEELADLISLCKRLQTEGESIEARYFFLITLEPSVE